MKIFCSIICLLQFALSVKAQYPFEQFDSIKYKAYENWITYDLRDTKKVIHQTLTILDFYDNHDSLTIQISSYSSDWKSLYIRIFRNKKEVQKTYEPMIFNGGNIWGPLIVADFNSDSLKDLKLNISYESNGLGMISKIIYLLQSKEGRFNKFSFDDNLEYGNRLERDFAKNGKYEIITMSLNGYNKHNYWTFDLFHFENGDLKNVDDEFGYPIMIQFLNGSNFKITDKISKEKMKEFKLKSPNKIDIK